jgi:hypothetical protein
MKLRLDFTSDSGGRFSGTANYVNTNAFPISGTFTLSSP